MNNNRYKNLETYIRQICLQENVPKSYVLENIALYSEKYRLNISKKEELELKNKNTYSYFRALQKTPKLTPYSKN